MNRELEIWQFAAEKLRRDESVMLLVVAESSGSSPGRQGFKMIVAADELAGSVGGGVMEVALVEQAKSPIANRQSPINSKIVEQVHRKNAPNASGMICSGKQTVIFFELNPKHLKEIEKIIFALENHQPRRLKISTNEFRVTPSGVKSPRIQKSSKQTRNLKDGEMLLTPEDVTLNETRNADFRFETTNENEFVYEERLGSKNRLFIVGGGHCALALSEIMSKMDFHISLFDDRADLNTLAKNSFVHEKKIIESYERIGEFIPSGANNYVVVMTLGFVFDEIVIRKLFDKEFKYFGVLGSRAKMKTLLKNLEKEGFDKEKLKQIRTPIGLKIHSRTPEEIAVSIAAEIIAVKNLV